MKRSVSINIVEWEQDGGRGRKRHKADRTERALFKMQNESILASSAIYEASLAKKEKAREQKLRKKEREKQYSLLNPIPKDFKKTFIGNIDDDFRLGVSLSKRQVKLFAPFYDSDLIVASPLGLRRVMGGEGEENREIDFLSSIEVVIIDEADLLLQQNWQHVKDIFSALNVTPLSPQHTDFSRVRESDLSGLLRFNRQTVIFSSYPDAEISSLVKKNCFNAPGGQVVIRASKYIGSMSRVISTIRQSFFSLSTGLQPKSSLQTVSDTDDARIEAFKSLVLPLLKPRGKGEEKTAQQPHTLIFIPSYFDYVRLRNLLDAENVEFSTCSEYSDDKDIATSRKSFRRGDSFALLVTERFHFFRRVRFFGVKHVVFYGPPRVANSYPEVLNWVEESGFDGVEGRGDESETSNTSLLLYSKFDGLQLERICGSEKASKMIRANRASTKNG
jgi:U3 small nucleolar RNA-associated protein 25